MGVVSFLGAKKINWEPNYQPKNKKASNSSFKASFSDPDGTRTRDHLRDRQVF